MHHCFSGVPRLTLRSSTSHPQSALEKNSSNKYNPTNNPMAVVGIRKIFAKSKKMAFRRFRVKESAPSFREYISARKCYSHRSSRRSTRRTPTTVALLYVNRPTAVAFLLGCPRWFLHTPPRADLLAAIGCSPLSAVELSA